MKLFSILIFSIILSFVSRGSANSLNQLSTLNQKKVVLEKKLVELKTKNNELKKIQKKLKGVNKKLLIASGIFTATSLGTIIAGVSQKNKIEKIVYEIKKTEEDLEEITADKLCGGKKDCKKIEVNENCNTKTIFKAIDDNNLDEVKCWLKKNPASIDSATAETGNVQYPNSLAYAIGRFKNNHEIILELIKEKPELIYTKLSGMELITWLFDERFISILDEVYKITNFDINYKSSVGRLVEIAVKASKTTIGLLDFLKKNGADFSDNSETPLIIWAVVRDNVQAIKFLFNNTSISRNYKFTGQYLPRRGGIENLVEKPLLHLAIDKLYLDSFRTLAKFVDKETQDGNGKTALEYLNCEELKKQNRDIRGGCENWEKALK